MMAGEQGAQGSRESEREHQLVRVLCERLKEGQAHRSPEEQETWYRRELFPLVRELFRVRHEGRAPEYHGHVLLVGTSPEPVVMALDVVRAQRVLFLCTNESLKELDTVLDLHPLKPSQMDWKQVDKNNPVSIYTAIKNFYESFPEPPTLAVDFTGGTKAMAAAAAMAGAVLGAHLYYVANDRYLRDWRRPEPGSEYLCRISDPYEVLGVYEDRQAQAHLKRYDFATAGRIWQEQARRLPPGPAARAQCYAHLAAAYQAWDTLAFEEAARKLQECWEQVNRIALEGSSVPLVQYRERLAGQLQHLQALSGLSARSGSGATHSFQAVLLDLPKVKALLFTLLTAAERAGDLERYDMAILFLYRSLELMAQRRLVVRGIHPDNPDWDHVGRQAMPRRTRQDLVKGLTAVRSRAGKSGVSVLPPELGVLDAYALLQILGDPLTHPLARHWTLFGRVIDARNHSILTHGLRRLTHEDYRTVTRFVHDLVAQFCAVEGLDFQAEMEGSRFITE